MPEPDLEEEDLDFEDFEEDEDGGDDGDGFGLPIDDDDQKSLLSQKTTIDQRFAAILSAVALVGSTEVTAFTDAPAEGEEIEPGAGTPVDEAQAKRDLYNGLNPNQQKNLRDLIERNSRLPVDQLLQKVDLKTMQVLADAITNAPPKTAEARALLELVGAKPPATPHQALSLHDIDSLKDYCKAITDGAISQATAKDLRAVLGAGADQQLRSMEAKDVVSLAKVLEGRTLNADQITHIRETLAQGGQKVADVVGFLNPDALKRMVDISLESQGETARLRDWNANPHKATDYGGHKYQRWLFGALEDVLQNHRGPSGRTLAEEGWRIVPSSNQSVGDRAGTDFVLFNTETGKWMPLDVTNKMKTGAKDKVFCKTYSSGLFDHSTGQAKNPADIYNWVNDYIESNKDRAFDMKEFRPPDLAPESDPRQREQRLQDYQRQLEAERQRLRTQMAQELVDAARLTGPDKTGAQERAEALRQRIEGFDALEREQVQRAAGHIGREVALQNNMSEGLRRFIETHAAYLKTPGNRSLPPGAAPASGDAAGRHARSMVRMDGAGNLQGIVGAGDDAKTFHAGNLDQAIDMAVDKLPLTQPEKDAIKLNLKNADPQLRARLLDAIREELVNSWEPLRSEINQERLALARAAYQGEQIIDPKDVTAAMEKLNREIFSKRFDIELGRDGNYKLVEKENGKHSLADLMRGDTSEQQTLRNRGEAAKANQLTRDAVDKFEAILTREIRAGMLPESFKSLAATLKVDAAKLNDLMQRAEVKVDSKVEPGKPKVIFIHNGKEIQPVDFNGDKIKTRDGKDVKLSEVRIEVRVSPNTDIHTMQADVLMGADQVLREISQNKRRPLGMKDVDFQARETSSRQAFDRALREAQIDRLKPLFEEARRMATASGAAFPPTDPKDLAKALDDACVSLWEKGAPDAQIQEFEDYVKRLNAEAESGNVELRRPASELAAEVLNGPPRANPHEQGLWFPEPVMDAEQERRAREALRRFGPNPLASQELITKYLERMRAEVQSWGPEGAQKAQLAARLAEQVSTDAALLRTEAQRLARQSLGSEATADAVARKAQAFINGSERPAGAGSAEFIASRERLEQLKQTHAEAARELRQLSEQRAQRLQEVANRFAREHGLPEFKVTPQEHMDSTGAYKRGAGEIYVHRGDLISNPAHVVEAMYHEMFHVQQDSLVLKHLAEKHQIDAPGSDPATREERVRRMMAEYQEKTGRAAERAFVDKVLELRLEEGRAAGAYGPKPLDQKQKEKAEALMESFKNNKPLGTEFAELGNTYRATRDQLNRLRYLPREFAASQDLLAELAKPEGRQLAERLFGSSDRSKWPEAVRQLMDQWEKAPKDGTGRATNFNEEAARDVLSRAFEQRLEQVNAERQRLYREYVTPLHEMEAHLGGSEVRRNTVERPLGLLPAPAAPAADQWRRVLELNRGTEQVIFKRGATPTGDPSVRSLDATFNPERPGDGYLELKFEGRPEGVRYFMDTRTKEVFVYSETAIGGTDLKLKTMTRTFDVEVLPKAQAEARLAAAPAASAVPRELVVATGSPHATGSADMLVLDETGRLKRTRIGLTGEVPRIGELNEETLKNLMRGWERDIDRELDRLKNDPTKQAEYQELLKHKEALRAVQGELAAGGERSRRVVEHYRDALKPGAETTRIAEVGAWRGRVATGAGVVIGVGILVAAGIGYYNRFIAPQRERRPSQGPGSLPSLSG